MIFLEFAEKKSPLKKRVLWEDVKNYLADMIMRGEYKPGDRLVETQIARELGVSQAPVREAIRDLVRMGTLEEEPYKGAYVRRFSVQDLKNVYAVRAELEGLAIHSAVLHISEEEINALQEIVEQMKEAAATGNLGRQIPLDIAFHETIVSASRNDILERAWKTVSISHWTYYGTYQYKYDKYQLVGRHQPILDAIRERDAQKAEELMRRHFLELKDMLEE